MKNKETYNPLVSVIVPNYNHAKYLDQRLQSILNQTYKNFEVIILDDKSTDNSLEVIDKYASDPHVREVVKNKVNVGKVFLQWQRGISLAKGELIWIAESDDFCEITFLQELVSAYLRYPNVVIAYSPVVFTDSEGTITGSYSRKGRTQFVKSRSFVTKYLTADNCIQNASCAIFSRTAALSIDNRYSAYKGIGDWWFWLELSEKGNSVIVNKHLSYFRRHENSTTLKYIKDGTNLRDEKNLLEYIHLKYSLPRWRMNYLNHFHADSKRNLPFDSQIIYDEMAMLWGFDKKYTVIESFVYRLLCKCRRDYLIRL